MYESKILLDENEVPKSYLNLCSQLKLPPPLHPGTMQPVPPEMLEALFAKELVRQGVSSEQHIPIPSEVRDALISLCRPTPLVRARRLEAHLKTPAKIYFKNESLNPCGSHKLNTALAQAYYNAKEGTAQLVTETGAGQWGTALSCASALFGIKCRAFMVRTSYLSKPLRKTIMHSYGAEVFPSPSDQTNFGRSLLAKDPNHPGSLGIAISEALEQVMGQPHTKYSLGSVLNHVLLHQSIIGLEAQAQLKKAEETADVIIGCVGGGSNFAGIAFPFAKGVLDGTARTKLIAVEPTACPSITKGKYEYDFGDTAGTTPLLKMHTLGKDFIPSPIHAGGLRYHGMAPAVSALVSQGIIEARAYEQEKTFDAALTFAKTEGIVPAPESSHAIAATIDEALLCREKNEEKTILFNLSGHGLLDLNAYESYMSAKR